MGLAALLILIFHFYIPVTSWKYEQLFARISYLGVDIFFFLSAYGLGKSKAKSYWAFIKKRFSKVYFKYVAFTVIAAIYSGYSLTKVFRILTGLEFFKRGGGAFLWFVTAIMITYLFIPLANKLKQKTGLKGFGLLMAIWLVLAIVLQYVIDFKTIFIYVNRLPIIFIGLYYDELKLDIKKYKWVFDTFVLALSVVILFRYGATNRLNVPFTDSYYLLVIPTVLALVSLVENQGIIFEGVLTFMGGITLELYGLQMIFGYKIESAMLKLVGNGFAAFVLTALILTAMAYLFNYIYSFIERKFVK